MDAEKKKTLFSACAFIALVPAYFTSYVPCEPCDGRAMSMCPPVPTGCQVVKEPGCGCCLTCALREGHECGVYTGTCATGLRCLPRDGEEKPLHALLHGRGVCMNEKGYRSARDKKSPDDVLGPVTEDLRYHSKVLLFPQDHINNKRVMAVLKARKQKGTYSKVMDFIDYPSFKVEKVQPEMGLCRRKLDRAVRQMKDIPRVMALSLYLPNCDKKGFFKRKQCKPSRGRKRGICWCVDKYGAMMPGTDYSGGNIQCRDQENDSNNK
ncbi:insulin-like growth factor-binding protein 5a [Clarias gariepinus]|uniref:insulin-like growth factor-binding protein 5a n=1 Tax=Clarias gariepinus TaxID=13013 RepID=UPI00234CDA20|nr:insulin-like growth factor-binding protein 5a [Clarias gariepinus]